MIFSKKRSTFFNPRKLGLAACLTALALVASCTQMGGPNQRPVRGTGKTTTNAKTQTRTVPSGGKGSYLASGDEISFELSAVNPEAAIAGIQPVQGQSFKQALQATYTNDDHGPWMAVLKTSDTLAIPQDAAVIATFHARSAAPYNSDRDAVIGFYVYREDPWRQLTANRILVDDQWREYSVIFTPDQSYKNGELSVAFDVGQKKQTVELGNIRLRNLAEEPEAEKAATSSTYAGRSENAGWRKAAAERIQQHRMGPMSIRVLDASGKPASQAQISYKLDRHAFGIGTAVNKRLVAHQDTPDHQRYAQMVKTQFNKAVLENGMKWNQWESSYAPFLKEDTLKAVDWLHENGLAIRGTALVWPGWDKQNPDGLKDLKPADLQQRVDAHIRDLVGTFKGKVSEWDVVNEARTNQDFTKKLGANAIPGWFKLAGSIDPDAKLYLNDFGILNGSDTAVTDLENTVKAIQQAGAPIHGIGLQSHFDSYLPSPERMQEILDRLGKLGLDIQATEFDINLADEATQADFTRDFLTVLFSHPSVTGVTVWGFWEGQHWKPDCALYRRDWSTKPNGQAFFDLFNKEWTRAGKLRGPAQTFYGDYAVEVTHAGKTTTHTIRHSKDVKEHVIDLRKPGKVETIAADPTSPKPAVKKPTVVQPTPKVIPLVPPKVVKPAPKLTPPSVIRPQVVKPAPKVLSPTPRVVKPAPKLVKPAPKVVTPVPKVVTPPKMVPAPKVVTPTPRAVPAPKIVLPGQNKPVPKVLPVPRLTKPTLPTLPKPKIPKPDLPKVTPPVVKIPTLPTPVKPKITLPKVTPKSIPVPTSPKPNLPKPIKMELKPEGPAVKTPELKKPSITLPKPKVTLPKPKVLTPPVKPVAPKVIPAPSKPEPPKVTLPSKPKVTLPEPKVNPPKVVPTLPKPAAPKTVPTAPKVTPPVVNPAARPIPKVVPQKPSVQLPQVKPAAPTAPSATTTPIASDAQERMMTLKERLRKARERMQEKAAEQK